MRHGWNGDYHCPEWICYVFLFAWISACIGLQRIVQFMTNGGNVVRCVCKYTGDSQISNSSDSVIKVYL